MASLATAFVSIRPDTTGFGARLSSSVRTDASKAGTEAGRHLSSKFGAALKIGGLLAGAFAVTKGISFFKDSIAEATEAAKVGAQTTAVLKSTGGAAGVTRKHIEALATAISNKTGIDDEAIQSGENLLLTFKNVRDETGKGNKIFSQATSVITDMSAALGQDTKSSAIQLGKALNDPVKGITALSRVGVTFNQGQKDTIKRMVETGNTLGAQKVILRELNSEFKGSAEAQATPAEKAAVAWGNFKELLGGAVLPIVAKVAEFLSERLIPALTGFVKGMQDGTGPGGKFADIARKIGAAFAFLAPKVGAVIGFLVKNKAAVAAFVGVIGGFLIFTKIAKAVRLFSIALAASPIGIAVIAVAALAAGLVYAYKHSETFRKVVDKAFKVIRQAAKVAWEDYIRPALTALGRFITNTLIPTVNRLWRNVVKPAFEGIGHVIGFMWRNVVKPIFSAYKFYLTEVLFPVIRFLWNDVVKPVFAGLGKTIAFVWTNVVKPTFSALKRGVGAVGDAFGLVVHGIRTVWSRLKEIAAAPVRFIIDTVYNNGIRKVVNAIPGVGNLPKISGFSSGGYTGPGRRYDPAGIVHAGEFVHDQETTNRARPILEALHRTKGRLFGYARGGRVVWPTTGHITSSYPGHDGVDINGVGQDYGNPIFAFRSGRVTYAGAGHGYGNAVFESTSAANVVYGHMSRILARAGQIVRAGQMIGRVGSSGHSTGPHLHFGIPGGTFAQAMGLLRGASYTAGGAAAAAGYEGPTVAAATRSLNPAGWIHALRNIGGWGPMLGGTVKTLAGSALKFVSAKIKAAVKAAKNFAGEAIGTVGGVFSGNKSVRNIVRSLAIQRGWGSGSEWESLQQLISHESGFNPRAQNPSSTAYGLFQFLNGTWAGTGVRKTSDPARQTIAGLRYITSRYGDPNGAWNYWQAHHSYDAGGMAYGKGYISKQTSRPERVLSPRQTDSFERLVDMLGARGAGGGGPRGGDRFTLVLDDGTELGGYVERKADDRISDHRGFDDHLARLR